MAKVDVYGITNVPLRTASSRAARSLPTIGHEALRAVRVPLRVLKHYDLCTYVVSQAGPGGLGSIGTLVRICCQAGKRGHLNPGRRMVTR